MLNRGIVLVMLVGMPVAPSIAQTARSTGAKTQTVAPAIEHDLSGVWTRSSRVQTFSNTQVEEAPFTALGKAKFDANKPSYGPRAIPPALGNDPMGTCDPLGIPRWLTLETTFATKLEIVQLPDRVVQFFERWRVWRDIYTDGRELPKDLEPSWLGYSIGKWEGDTFVVDTIGLDERTWLDHFGYPHSEDARLQERYRRIDPDTLEFTMTLTDPKLYSKPWTSDKKVLKLSKQPMAQSFCVPSDEQSFNKLVRDPAAGVTRQ